MRTLTSLAPSGPTIKRPRLTAQLLAVPEATWLVVGPAFSGKSTLLDEIGDHLSGSADVIRLNAENDWKTGDRERDGVWTLVDDYDVLETEDPERSAALLLDVVKRGAAIIASRCFPNAPLARWRLNGKLHEIGPADLALDQDEIMRWLQLAPESLLDDVGFLLRRTAGWLAPVCIIQSIRQSDDRSLHDIAADLSGGAGILRDFIEQEIISRLSASERELLLTIAAFHEITAETIQQFTGDNSRARLVDLSRKLPLLVPKNAIEDAYELHPLLKEFCEAQLKDERPERWQELMRAAAGVCLREGNGLGAASLLLKIEDYAEAAQVLGRYADRAFGDLGATQQFFSLCQQLPEEQAGTLNKTFWIARGAVVAGAFGYAARLIGHLEAQGECRADDDRLEVIHILVDLGFANFESVHSRSTACLASSDSSHGGRAIGPLDRAMIASALALANLARLDLRGCDRAIARAKAETDRTDAQYFKGWVSIINILRLREMARFDEAILEARDLVARGSHAALRPTCQLILANLLSQKGDLFEAKDLVDRYYRAGAKHGVAETAMMALEAVANVEQHVTGIASALNLVRDSEHPIDRAFGERARRLAKVKYLEILLLSDEAVTRENIPVLLKEIGEWNQGARSGDLWLEERAIIVRALHLLRSGDPRGTISLLGPVIVRAKASGRFLAESEARLVRIAAEAQLEDDDRVSRALLSTIETLVQLGAEGVVAKFRSILKLPLQRLESVAKEQMFSSRDETANAVRRLISSFRERSPASEVESELLLEVTLTPTEARVLKHAAAGLRNAEIADRMIMSVQTAKWHLHNIFAKMGVKNRTTAILRAKELMLI